MTAGVLERVLVWLLFAVMVVCGCDRTRPAAAARPVQPAVADVRVAPADTAPSAPAIDEARVRAALAAWLGAQNEGDFERYQQLYAPNFEGIKRVGKEERHFDRAGWLADRKRMFQKPMTVRATDVVVAVEDQTATVEFSQSWASGDFEDVGPKRIVFEQIDGALRIQGEQMLQSSVLSTPVLQKAVERAETDYDFDVYREVRDLMAEAHAGKPRTVLVSLATTIDYGCRCPFFVFSQLHGDAEYKGVATPYVYPLVSKGPLPRDYLLPAEMAGYNLRGHFEGGSITGEQWLRRDGADPVKVVQRGDLDIFWQDEGPVFLVDSWCLDVDEELKDDAYYGKVVTKAIADGVVCEP